MRTSPNRLAASPPPEGWLVLYPILELLRLLRDSVRASVHPRYLGGPRDARGAARCSRPVRNMRTGSCVACGRLVGRCGRASCGRGARASIQLRDPWLRVNSARPLEAAASRPLDADAADAKMTVNTQAVKTIAVTWYCVVSQVVQRPEGARCSELHTFAIARAAQPVILPGRSDSAPKGRTADCNLRGDPREPQQLVYTVSATLIVPRD